MTINLEGMQFGRHIKDPVNNVKHFGTKNHQLTLTSTDPNKFTDWGVIELIDLYNYTGLITMFIDSEQWGWYATAHIVLKMNGYIALNDNFQSGVIGPIGNPMKVKKYPIGDF